MAKSTQRGSCETCTYYTYDEEYESYMCDVNMDEDEYMRLISDQHYQCPYYRNGDDYRIVRHQMYYISFISKTFIKNISQCEKVYKFTL